MYSSDESINRITREEFSQLNTEEKILKISRDLVPPKGKPENMVLETILGTTEKEKPSTKTIYLKYLISAAAAIALIIVGYTTILTAFSKEKVTVPFGRQTEVTLPDGSVVILNAGTDISWNKKDFSKQREINLKGEAFLTVIKGNNFTVKTPNGKVEVLGTQFNVVSRKGEFQVSCLTGKVRVSANNLQKILLSGEETELTAGGLIKYVKKDIKNSISWKDGLLYFEDKPLIYIFEEVERQFDISIKYSGIQDRLMTVSFSDKDLEEALNVICIPMELDYEINNNKVRIYDKKKE